MQELDRIEGPGKLRNLGASAVWESRRLEVHLDPAGDETRLVLTDKPGVLDWTRAPRYAAIGLVVAVSTIVPMTVEALENYEGLVAAIVFSALFAGAWYGRKFSQRRDRTLEARRRAELEAVATRLAVLADANL